ncbi:MAG: DsbA family oxidoreductase [Aquabacterium sp.]|nr:DsbA family oxidoreductase [Aquabacterium sp.]
MKIDFVSDVSCPWCAIGLNALEQALARVGPDIQATLHFQPFELNPQMPGEGQDVVEHLSQKYGIGAEQIAANAEAIRQRGAGVGFIFGQGKRRRIYNTFDAHRLLHWAGLVDADKQRALKHALFKAYFTDGLNPGDHTVLLQAATAAGLDAAEAGTILAGDAHAAAVRNAEQFYHQQGISSVPAVIINDQHLISGGQPVELFERALRHIAAEAPGAAA